MHDVKVGERELVELAYQMAVEIRSFGAFVDAPHRDARRQADRRPVRADLPGDGGRHLDGETRAILDGAAIHVGSRVRARRNELLHQISIRAMDLDTVRTCRNGVARGVAEIGNGPAHVIGRERPRLRNILHALRREYRRIRRDRGRGHTLAVMRRVVRMRHASGMHELDEDMAALAVDGVRNLAPASDMCGRVDARRGHVALPVIGWLRALGDDQSNPGALSVIFGGEAAGNAISIGARTRHGRHDQAV